VPVYLRYIWPEPVCGHGLAASLGVTAGLLDQLLPRALPGSPGSFGEETLARQGLFFGTSQLTPAPSAVCCAEGRLQWALLPRFVPLAVIARSHRLLPVTQNLARRATSGVPSGRDAARLQHPVDTHNHTNTL
jgi:hypothetical protein